jgi:spermidine synthase
VSGALKDDGIMVAQSESPFYHAEIQKNMYANLRSVFQIIQIYPNGLWSFAPSAKNIIRSRTLIDYATYTRYHNEGLPLAPSRTRREPDNHPGEIIRRIENPES